MCDAMRRDDAAEHLAKLISAADGQRGAEMLSRGAEMPSSDEEEERDEVCAGYI